ncbi:MAG: UPF0489 family protein [Candidatus Omnitrophica bacterium]|nr:UPF0489 family protein [Candidatus Omnitrophota bacterium]
MTFLKKNITLFEDHTQSYYEWKKRKFQKMPLVHIDAHLDFAFFAVKKPVQALEEAKSFDELKRDLEKYLGKCRSNQQIDKQENIGNYIYPAMKDGLVSDFYWVIPGKLSNNTKILNDKVFLKDPYRGGIKYESRGKVFRGKIYNQKFMICSIDKITVSEPVLLDIDLDYLMYKLGEEKSSDKSKIKGKNIERKPWMYPKEFVETLIKKFPHPAFITIAYSVNGGYTPILYKFLGDEIYLRLAGFTKSDKKLSDLLDKKNIAIRKKNISALDKIVLEIGETKIPGSFKKRFLAHTYFWLFYLTGKAKYYCGSVALDKSYRAKDNNYGWEYLKIGNFKKAQSEFERILKADPLNKYALLGISQIFARDGFYEKAYNFLKKADNPDREVYLNLANYLCDLKRYKQADFYLSKVKVLLGFGYYLKARTLIGLRPLNKKSAINCLKTAVLSGFCISRVWKEAVKVLTAADCEYSFFETRYNEYKNMRLKSSCRGKPKKQYYERTKF